jgi:septal ring factor EnvC (AmiA/AmiB activator)
MRLAFFLVVVLLILAAPPVTGQDCSTEGLPQLVWPLADRSGSIVRLFGPFVDSESRLAEMSHGIHIRHDAGTPVVSAIDGIVVHEDFRDNGILVIHNPETGVILQYRGLDVPLSVRLGEAVTMGQTVGTLGGWMGDGGALLDVRVCFDGVFVDPAAAFWTDMTPELREHYLEVSAASDAGRMQSTRP